MKPFLVFIFCMSATLLSAEIKNSNSSRDSVFYVYKYAYTMETDSSYMREGEIYMYIEKFTYPEVFGISDTAILNKINNAISGDIKDDMQESFLKKELKYVDQKTFEALPYPRDYSSGGVYLIEFNQEFITFSKSYEWDGGAHPSFSYLGTFSYSLKTGEPIKIGDILKSGWMPYYIDAVMNNESLKQFSSDGILDEDACEDVLDAVLIQIKEFTNNTPVVVERDGILIYSADYRDFGCPEISRDVFEVVISWETIKDLLIMDKIYALFEK